ncbi:MAG TPA: ribosome maturation factor RimM [Solirubrobacteraceae bacterium]|nr:ribosome maturation factor RimM [Solirubrobacteraceae bacterium]
MSEARADLSAGRVGRAHGLDGSFYVTGPRPRLLTLGTEVEVAARRSEIVRRAGTDQHPIVRLDGIDDRSAAEALRGESLTVQAAQAPQLGEGEWWAHELEGCAVLARGRELGVVARLIELPSCEALEVRLDDDGDRVRDGAATPATLLVPMVRDAIGEVDVAARRIEVNPDFLDLPEPGDGT